jgi:hypothetical protein
MQKHHLLKARKAIDLNQRMTTPPPTWNSVTQQRQCTLSLGGMTKALQNEQRTRQQTKQ